MNFWNFNLFCYLCQYVFDPQCKDIFLSTNLSVGFIVTNITQYLEINDCELKDFNLIFDENSTLIKYNYLRDTEEIVDYIENEISVDEKFSFFINYNSLHQSKQKFNLIKTNNPKNKDYDFINFNKKSLFKLLPNIFETTRNISTIYFDLYINETVGFFTSGGKPKLSYYWLKDLNSL